MITYKILESKYSTQVVGRYVAKIDNQTIMLATPTKPQMFIDNYYLNSCVTEQCNLEDIKWIHPHLYKPIKKEIYENLEKDLVDSK